MNLAKILENRQIKTSVPCRIDFGGTLDLSTFYLAMINDKPSTFNIALDMRTHVELSPWKEGVVKVSSRGFDSAEFEDGQAPFDHPMGLMFGVANYFGVHGVHIKINSTSPPRSALGGSSSAAVAIVAALYQALDKPLNPEAIAWLALYIEASVAGVPCGLQDQLAAAYGGVNQWMWQMGDKSPRFERVNIFNTKEETQAFNDNLLVSYCGIPHVSKNINSQWVKSFISGETREVFRKIVGLTDKFSKAVKSLDFRQAADLMVQETEARLSMTPDVLDNVGKKLFEKAVSCDCGARFTGAGGGGCLWAIGNAADIKKLKPLWQDVLSPIENATVLDTKIENEGIIIY
jgi:D-glycero-alpha-D-manno-heptose-7-phosphate kinase